MRASGGYNMKQQSKGLNSLPSISALKWVASLVLLISAQASWAADDQVVVEGESGAATQRDVMSYSDLAQKEAASPRLLKKTTKAWHRLLKEPGDLPVPGASGLGTFAPRASATSQNVAFASLAAPLPGPPALASPPASASFAALLDSGTQWEPDTQGAAGPNHLMVTLNTQVRIQNRQGGVVSTVSLDGFWAIAGVSNAIDPRVLYDPFGQRWITTAAADPDGKNPGLLIAVSKTSDPTGLWNRYFIDVDTTTNVYAVAPTVGFNKDWIVLQANIFLKTAYDFVSSDIYVFNKTNLYAGGVGLRTRFSTNDIGTGQAPAVTYDNTLGTVYLLKNWNGSSGGVGYLRLFSISGPVLAPTLTYGPFVESLDLWSSYPPNDADNAPQLGSSAKIYTGDSRIQNLVYRNGTLWAAHTVYFEGEPSCSIQWWEVSPAGAVFQQGFIEDRAGTNYFAFPSIAVNRMNEVVVGYSKFSSNQYPSAYYAFRQDTDALEQLRSEVLLKAGEAPYYRDHDGVNRWGDESATVIDPLNDTDFWTIQEYASGPVAGASRWGTWWGQIAPPNDLAVTLSDAPDPITAGANLTYSVVVTNLSASIASGVVLVDTLPAGAIFVSATASPGSCTFSEGIVTCDLGTFDPAARGTATILIKPTASGQNTNSVLVTSNGQDANASDNAAMVVTTVNASADLALLMAASPDPVTISSNLTFLVTVTNQGPSSATGVNVTDTLPAGVAFVSATPAQGSCSRNGSTVICALGAIASRGNVTIAIVVTPAAAGMVTNRATATAASSDPNSGNNSTLASALVNSAPTLSPVSPQTVLEDFATPVISFTVGDLETPVGSLTVTASSSNPALVPDANIALGGSGASRTVKVTPLPNQAGTATITLTVSDARGAATSTAFLVTVTAVNDPPTLSPVANLAIDEDTKAGPLSVTLADVDNSVASLILTATSSNPTLVPSANIVLAGSGANRTVTVTPATNQFGTTLITLTVSDGIANASQAFTLTVNSINDPPTISDLLNLTIDEDTKSGPLSFTVGDVETAVASLTVAGSSSDLALVPNANVVVGGSGANRTVTVTPATNRFGTTIITVSVSDGSATASDTFTLTVTPVNDPPTLNPLNNLELLKNAGLQMVNLSGISSGADNENQVLSVTAAADPPGLLTNLVVSYTSPGATGSLTFTTVSNAVGSAVVTVTVDDGQSKNSKVARTFTVTITSLAQPPTITDLADRVIDEDAAAGPLAFTVADPDTPAGSLTLAGGSSNPTLVPVANIVFGGSGADRTVTITPATNQFGTTVITVTVSDGGSTASDSLTLTVNPINDPPTISVINNPTSDEDTKSGPLNFTVRDVETPAASLTVTGGSSNPTLVPSANIVFGGSGADRTVTVTPATNQFGTALITVTVSDGSASAQGKFTLTVTSVNDLPTITDILDQAIDATRNTGPLSFTVGDVETPASGLTLAGESSNPALIPNGNIIFGGSGASRTVTVTPVPNGSGTATISVRVTDADGGTRSDTFVLSVRAVNTPPSISLPNASQTIDEDQSTGAIPVTVGDAETPAANLVLTASSSNEELATQEGITFQGSGTRRTVTIRPLPNQFGATTITITVTDGNNAQASTSLELTVRPVNDAPTLSPIADQAIEEGTVSGPLSFTVGDPETAAGNLIVEGSSSNTTLVPDQSIVFGGSGANRTVTVRPAAKQSGTATITVTVQDGQAGTTNGAFVLTVRAAVALRISKMGENVLLSWDASALGYVLQASSSLSPGSIWTTVPEQPVLAGGRYEVTQPLSGGNKYYRLVKIAARP